jgi:hypothetical protein
VPPPTPPAVEDSATLTSAIVDATAVSRGDSQVPVFNACDERVDNFDEKEEERLHRREHLAKRKAGRLRKKRKALLEKSLTKPFSKPADSAVSDAFNKPPFHNYGRMSASPMTSSHMLITHNASPHAFPNEPSRNQVSFSVVAASNSTPARRGRGHSGAFLAGNGRNHSAEFVAHEAAALDARTTVAQALEADEEYDDNNPASVALRDVSVAHLREIAVLTKPPDAVKAIAEALCILFDIKPAKVRCQDTNKTVWDYWGVAKRVSLCTLHVLPFYSAMRDASDVAAERSTRRHQPTPFS